LLAYGGKRNFFNINTRDDYRLAMEMEQRS
jgi:molybdopterin-guanine dinucleotide biosynthesis protein A